MAEPERQRLSLDALLASGLDVGGRAADRIKVRVPGVGWSMISLPLGEVLPSGEPEDDSELTPTQVRILEVLKKSKVPMTRRGIANAMERESVSGTFGRYIADLVSRDIIREYGGELADDPKKFKTA